MNTPDTHDLWERDKRSIWHPYTPQSAIDAGPLPIIVRGEGIYLYDTEGRRYFDAISSWWACNLGHGNPEIIAAIKRQADRLQHSILGGLSHPSAIELADRLRELGGGHRHIIFASDGASAVEAALKIAAQYWWNLGRPGKCRFASLQQAYHGDTLGAISVGFMDNYHAPFRALRNAGCHQAEPPCCGTCAYGLPPPDCGMRCFESMRSIIADHAGELAAVIVEPLCQGAAGMRIYDPAYLRLLAQECREHEVLLIADEIAVGFGRTGRMFAYEHAGVVPDIVCLGKAMSGGYLPISATSVRDEIAATFSDKPVDHTFFHGHTFAGNPLAAAAACAALDIYERDNIALMAHTKGRFMADKFAALKGYPGMRNVRTLGMIAAIELRAKPGLPARICAALCRQGILLRPLGDVIYLMPPLITPDDMLGDAIETLIKTVREEASR